MARSIGITGNIGSGKSAVARLLESIGCERIDADLVARAALEPCAPAWEAVVQRFGRHVLLPDGTIDRSALARIVFSDAHALADLDHAVHPYVVQTIRDHLASGAPHDIVAVEAIKLIEAGLTPYLDAVWLVEAPPAVAVGRLVADRGLPEEEARRRLLAQPPPELKRAVVDTVIDNGGQWAETERQVRAAFEELCVRWESERRGQAEPAR